VSIPLETLKKGLPLQSWTQDADIIAPHLVEWRDKYQGRTPLMLTPRSTQEVANAVKICAQHNIKIVPQGGNTGLVGGQTPMGEVLLSTCKMMNIRELNGVNNAMIVEAGATLQSIHDAAESIKRKFPLFLASQGTCTIGGNLSTNAGGNHVLKYGTTKELVEGTLGIITAASLKLFPKPEYIQRVMVGTDSPAKAMTLLNLCQTRGALSMFEVIPAIGFDAVVDNIPNQRNPFTQKHPWYVLIDWEVASEAEGKVLAETKLSEAFDQSLIRDAVIAQNKAQATQLLALRENMSAGQKFLGGSIKFDITVPLLAIPEFLADADNKVKAMIPGCRPVSFGHFGDGNIHYNVAQPLGADKATFLESWQKLSELVFDIVGVYEGSISAEHGIGTMKKADLAKRADPVKLAMLKRIKTALDPQNIMNPRVMV